MAFPSDYTLLGNLKFPTVAGSHSGFVALVKYSDFTSAMLAGLDDGGGDLRFSSDAAGVTQLPCEIEKLDKTTSEAFIWVRVATAATDEKVYVWGDNTGDSQPSVTDSFGRNAVWVDYEGVFHLNDYSDSAGNMSDMVLFNGSTSPTQVDVDGDKGYDFGTGSTMLSSTLTTDIENSTGLFTLQIKGLKNTIDAGLNDKEPFASVAASSGTGGYDFGFEAHQDDDPKVRLILLTPQNNDINGSLVTSDAPSVDAPITASVMVDLANNNVDAYAFFNSAVLDVTSDAGDTFPVPLDLLGIGGRADTSPSPGNVTILDAKIRYSLLSTDYLDTEFENQSSSGPYFIATDAPTGPNTPINPSITDLLATSARLNWEQG